MNKEDLFKCMCTGKAKNFKIIDAIEIDDRYRLGIYVGEKGELDIIVKYMEKIAGKWTQVRTPKHSHWITDILIKRSHNKEETQKYVQALKAMWEGIKPMASEDERQNLLQTLDNLVVPDIVLMKGLHDTDFLFKMIYLLMVQEKTNYPQGTITSNILHNLENEDDWFSLLSGNFL